MATAIDPHASRMFIVDAHRANSEERFIIHSNEPLTAFLELEEQLRRPAVPHSD